METVLILFCLMGSTSESIIYLIRMDQLMPVAHSSSHIASQLIGTKLIKQIGLSIICIANAKNNNKKVTIEQSTAKCNQMMFFYSNQTFFFVFYTEFFVLVRYYNFYSKDRTEIFY